MGKASKKDRSAGRRTRNSEEPRSDEEPRDEEDEVATEPHQEQLQVDQEVKEDFSDDCDEEKPDGASQNAAPRDEDQDLVDAPTSDVSTKQRGEEEEGKYDQVRVCESGNAEANVCSGGRMPLPTHAKSGGANVNSEDAVTAASNQDRDPVDKWLLSPGTVNKKKTALFATAKKKPRPKVRIIAPSGNREDSSEHEDNSPFADAFLGPSPPIGPPAGGSPDPSPPSSPSGPGGGGRGSPEPTPPPSPSGGGGGSHGPPPSPPAGGIPPAPPKTPKYPRKSEIPATPIPRSNYEHRDVPRRKKLSELLKLIVTLDPADWFTWDKQLLSIAYHAEWGESVLNTLDLITMRWDGVEEQDVDVREKRRQGYMIIKKKTPPDLSHLIEDQRQGDAAAVYKALRLHCQDTTQGVIHRLHASFLRYSQANLGINLNGFISRIKSTERELISLGVTVSDMDMKGILLEGLLMPEFKYARTLLNLENPSRRNFYSTSRFLKSWARQEGLEGLKRGGQRRQHIGSHGSPHARAFVSRRSDGRTTEPQQHKKKKSFGAWMKQKNLNRNAGKAICNDFNRDGSCKRGTKCPFIHKKYGEDKRHNEKKHDFKCFNCQQPGHYAAQCKQKKQGKENYQSRGIFYLRAQGGGTVQQTSTSGPDLQEETDTSEHQEHTKKNKHILWSKSIIVNEKDMCVADGGAGNVVVNDFSYFIPGTEEETSTTVTVGDGKEAIVRWTGTVRAACYDELDNYLHDVDFKNAILLENCPVNLIAEHPLDEKGCRVIKEGGEFSCLMKKKDNTWENIIMGKLDRKHGNYELFMKLRRFDDSADMDYDAQAQPTKTSKQHGPIFESPHPRSSRELYVHSAGLERKTATTQATRSDDINRQSTLENVSDPVASGHIVPISGKKNGKCNWKKNAHRAKTKSLNSSKDISEQVTGQNCSDDQRTHATAKLGHTAKNENETHLFLAQKVQEKPLTDEDLLKLHRLHGHAGYAFIRKLYGLPIADPGTNPSCSACAMTTFRRANKPKKLHVKSEVRLQRIYLDYGIMPVYSRFKHYAFLLILDDCSRKMWVILVKDRGEGIQQFIDWHNKTLQTSSPLRTTYIHSDNEFNTKLMRKHCDTHGITLETSLPYSQYQNGPAEIRMYHIVRRLKASLIRASLPVVDWSYAVLNMVDHLNDEHCKALYDGKPRTPNEVWYNNTKQPAQYKPHERYEFGSGGWARTYGNDGKMSVKAIKVVILRRIEYFRAWLVRSVDGNRRVFFTRDLKPIPNYFPYNMPKLSENQPSTDILTWPLSKNHPSRSSDVDRQQDTYKEVPNSAPELSKNTAESETTDLHVSEAEPQEPPQIDDIRVGGPLPTITEHEEIEKPPPDQEMKQVEVEDPPADGATHVSDTNTVYENLESKINRLQEEAYDHLGMHDGPTNDENERMDQYDKTIDSVDSEWKPRRGARARNFSDKALDNIVTQGTSKVYYNNTNPPISQVPTFVPQNFHHLPDPKNDREMKASPDRKFWVQADSEEMAQIIKNKTFELVPPQKWQRVRGCRFIRKKKRDPNNANVILRYKSRLVCQGFDFTEGVEYTSAFAPVVRGGSTKIIMQIAVQEGLRPVKYDIDVYYLSGIMDKKDPVIFMKQASGYEVQGREHYVCQLGKSLYGLPHAHRLSQKRLNQAMKKAGFKALDSDPMVFILRKGKSLIIMGWHVDDGLAWHNDDALMKECEDIWKTFFSLKRTTNLVDYLGLQIVDKLEAISIHQSEKIQELLEKLKMEECKPGKVPARSGIGVVQDIDGVEAESRKFQSLYAQVVGLLIWISMSRKDCVQVINKLASRMSASNAKDLEAVRFLARYLKGTINRLTTFRKQKRFVLYAYFDSSFADCNDSRSTGGWCIFLGDPSGNSKPTAAIIVESFKQKLISHSTFEAEWYSADDLCKAIEWVRGLLYELGYPMPTTVIYGDNEQVLTCGEQSKLHARTKHWKLRMKYVQFLVQARIIAMSYVPSASNTADLTTKSLPFAAHDVHARRIMGQEAYTALYVAAHQHHQRSVMLEPHINDVPHIRCYGKRFSSDVTGDGDTHKKNDKPRVRKTKHAPKVSFAGALGPVRAFMIRKRRMRAKKKKAQQQREKIFKNIYIYRDPHLKEPWKYMKPNAVATVLSNQHEAISEKAITKVRNYGLKYGKAYNGDITGDGHPRAAAARAAAARAAPAGSVLRFVFTADENQDDQVVYIPGVGQRRGYWVRRSTRISIPIERLHGTSQQAYRPRFTFPDHRDDHYARMLADAEFERSIIASPDLNPRPPKRRRRTRILAVQSNDHQVQHSTMSDVHRRLHDRLNAPPMPIIPEDSVFTLPEISVPTSTEIPIPPVPSVVPAETAIKTEVKKEKTIYPSTELLFPSPTVVPSRPVFTKLEIPTIYPSMLSPMPLVRQSGMDALPEDADDYTREMWCHETMPTPEEYCTCSLDSQSQCIYCDEIDYLLPTDWSESEPESYGSLNAYQARRESHVEHVPKKPDYGKEFNGDMTGDGHPPKQQEQIQDEVKSTELYCGNHADAEGNARWRQYTRTNPRLASWCQDHEALRCHICAIECTDMISLIAHLKGKKHRKVIKGELRWCAICCKFTDQPFYIHDNSDKHLAKQINPIDEPLWKRNPLIPNAYDEAMMLALEDFENELNPPISPSINSTRTPSPSPPSGPSPPPSPSFPRTPSPASTEIWAPVSPLAMPLIAPVADAFIVQERSWGPYIVLSTMLSTMSICACIIWKS